MSNSILPYDDSNGKILLRRCTNGDKCVNPSGPNLPATAEYFCPNKSRGGALATKCRACRNAHKREYNKSPQGKSKAEARRGTPERLAQQKKYRSKPETQAKDKAYRASPKRQASVRELRKQPKYAETIARYRGRFEIHAKQTRYKQLKRANQSNCEDLLSIEEWAFALSYFDNRCAYCGRTAGLWHKMSQDHYIPISAGGCYSADNIVPACYGIEGCNQSKGRLDPREWLIKKCGEREADTIERRINEYFQSIRAGRTRP